MDLNMFNIFDEELNNLNNVNNVNTDIDFNNNKFDILLDGILSSNREFYNIQKRKEELS